MNIKNYLDYDGLLYWKQKFQTWVGNNFAKIKDIPTSLPASDVSAWAKESTKPTYNKSEIGLSNVDNTNDASKPISTAQQAALNKKADKTELPTKTSQLSNDSNYVNTSSMTTAINNAISTVQGNTLVKLTSGQYDSNGVPNIKGENGKIYLVPNSGAAPNVFDEYYWDSANSKFELFGSTSVDLSEYLKETDFVPLSNAQLDEIMSAS